MKIKVISELIIDIDKKELEKLQTVLPNLQFLAAQMVN